MVAGVAQVSAATTSSKTTLVPGTRVGGYTLIRKIGQGGMGEVYEAFQRALKRRVAIKILADWASERDDLRARFLREGEVAARIRHHHIVEIYDVGTIENRPFLVMEYLEGKVLNEQLRLDGSMTAVEIAELMLPIMSGVAAAHDRGIVHRDLKPENIFLADTDSGIEPKVLDFGISHVLTSGIRLTMDAGQIGTPHYMSPEQARAEEVDGWSDQYSLGVMLYEMATGVLPRDHGNPLHLLRMVAEDGFPLPSTHDPTIDPRLERVILRAMEPLPHRRYADVRDMMTGLLPLASEAERAIWGRELSTVSVSERPSKDSGLRTRQAPVDAARAPEAAPSRRPWIFALLGLLLVGGAVATWAPTRSDDTVVEDSTATPADRTATPADRTAETAPTAPGPAPTAATEQVAEAPNVPEPTPTAELPTGLNPPEETVAETPVETTEPSDPVAMRARTEMRRAPAVTVAAPTETSGSQESPMTTAPPTMMERWGTESTDNLDPWE